MKLFSDFILGTYEPFWKSITINNKIIDNIEKLNPDILRNLVYVHENFHWLQLNSSSIGHIVSMIPFFQKKIVSFAIQSPKLFNRKIEVKKPLLKETEQLTEEEIGIINNDLHAIETSLDFFLNTTDNQEIFDNYDKINQGLFSLFDFYLMYSKEILEDKFGCLFYKELVKSNRKFWDKTDNCKLIFFHEDIPLIGFKDLVECSAHIVEIKHYRKLRKKYKLLQIYKDIDDSYFYNKEYFKPLSYIKYIFPEDNDLIQIQDFLLLAIHISINPSIIPFYNSTYSENNSISDIHPGMRFIKILRFIKKRYKSIANAMLEKNLYSVINKNLNWKNDKEHYKDFSYFYSDLYNKISIIDDGTSLIDNTKIFDIEYLIYKYYEIVMLKGDHYKYFMDISVYLNDPDLLDITLNIERKIHCPVLFNEVKKQYQVNISGTNYQFYNEKGEVKHTISTIKEKNDNISQEFLNYIILGMFYELDNQLLHEEGDFDFTILEIFDITSEMKRDLIHFYYKERDLRML